jgi:hypothetical protein
MVEKVLILTVLVTEFVFVEWFRVYELSKCVIIGLRKTSVNSRAESGFLKSWLTIPYGL